MRGPNTVLTSLDHTVVRFSSSLQLTPAEVELVYQRVKLL
jgi:hypothetical protein